MRPASRSHQDRSKPLGSTRWSIPLSTAAEVPGIVGVGVGVVQEREWEQERGLE